VCVSAAVLKPLRSKRNATVSIDLLVPLILVCHSVRVSSVLLQHPRKNRKDDPSLWDSPAHRRDRIQKDRNYENGSTAVSINDSFNTGC
jgi:hypothetical protein